MLGRHITITQDELLDEARRRFGDDIMTYAFDCPHCGDTATLAEWKELGDPGRAGQECVGRAAGADRARLGWAGRGCDWAAFGLFRGPWEITLPAEGGKPERPSWAFPLHGEPAPGGPVERELAKPRPERVPA
jgi:hypothetical protein